MGPINITPFFSVCGCNEEKDEEKSKNDNMMEINIRKIPIKENIPVENIKGNIIMIPAFASPLIKSKIMSMIPNINKIKGKFLFSISSLPPLIGLYCF